MDWKNILLFIFGILCIANLIFLDLIFFGKIQLPSARVSPQGKVVSAPDTCAAQCQREIQKALTLFITPTILESPPETITPTVVSAVTRVKNPREYFVPLGSGTLTSQDWMNVPGLQAYIDPSNYSGIQSAMFEVSVYIPTANQTATIRLYNLTDNHPVWSSDVNYTGGNTAQLLVSQPITLDTGNKLYQVQMKTQLEYPAAITSSRVRIITQ